MSGNDPERGRVPDGPALPGRGGSDVIDAFDFEGFEVLDEEPEWLEYRQKMIEELGPEGFVETAIAEQIALALYRDKWIPGVETRLLEDRMENVEDDLEFASLFPFAAGSKIEAEEAHRRQTLVQARNNARVRAKALQTALRQGSPWRRPSGNLVNSWSALERFGRFPTRRRKRSSQNSTSTCSRC